MPSTKQSSRRASRSPHTGPALDAGLADAAGADDADDADGDLVALPGPFGESIPAADTSQAADVLADQAGAAVPAAGALAPRMLTVTDALSGQRLDKALAILLPEFSRSRLQAWIESGAVLLNGSTARARQAVLGGDSLHVVPETSAESGAFLPEPVALDLVHEDESLAVINKPPGLVVHPAAGNWSGTLMNGLLYRYADASGLPRAGIVHRLDKDTSGLMVVARTLPAQTELVRQLQARTVKRTYLAAVWGVPPLAGTIDKPIGRDPADRLRMAVCAPGAGREARTHFRRLAVGSIGKAPVALVRCQLETGRTHQIRVHMEALGHPLLGDPVYRRTGRGVARAPLEFSRQALHAARLGLEHPLRREPAQWTVPLPEDMRALFTELGLPTDADLE